MLLQLGQIAEFCPYELSDQCFKDDAIHCHRVEPREMEEFSNSLNILRMLHMSDRYATLWRKLLHLRHFFYGCRLQ